MSQRTGRPRGLTPDGPKIRSLRVARGLTAVQVAAKIGCHRGSILNAEAGRPISDVLASRLATALSTPDEPLTLADITLQNAVAA